MSVTTLLDDVVLASPPVAQAADRLLRGKDGGAVAVARPAWPATLAAIHRASERPLLVVAPDD
ncbi:MAG: hypothetical protein AB1416_11435, partial [Actinomycetota bacterium]